MGLFDGEGWGLSNWLWGGWDEEAGEPELDWDETNGGIIADAAMGLLGMGSVEETADSWGLDTSSDYWGDDEDGSSSGLDLSGFDASASESSWTLDDLLSDSSNLDVLTEDTSTYGEVEDFDISAFFDALSDNLDDGSAVVIISL